MAKIMLDFIQCHHCGKHFYDKPDFHSGDGHWRDCPENPTRPLVEAATQLVNALYQYYDAGTLPAEVEATLGRLDGLINGKELAAARTVRAAGQTL